MGLCKQPQSCVWKGIGIYFIYIIGVEQLKKRMRKTEETEQKLIDAAYCLIKADGFDATSIKKICAEAGVAYSTFYFYFPSKEHIIPKFYSRIRLFSENDFAAILGIEGAWDRLWFAHTIYLDHISEIGPEICAQYYRCNLSYPETARETYSIEHQKVLEPLISQAQRSGEILNRMDSESVYSCSLNLVRGIYFNWSTHLSDFDLHSEMRRNLEVFYQVREDPVHI